MQKALRAWFKALSKATKGILRKNIYNMDESGFSIGSSASTRVIIDTQTSGTQYSAHLGRQEWVSVLECISADGNTIPPLMIFKGTGINTRNIADEVPDGWKVSSSPKG